MRDNSFLKADYFKYLLVSLLTIAIYGNTIQHDFTWDDQLVISQNTATMKGLEGLSEIWTSYAYLQDRPVYRPVPQSIHAILWEISPNTPALHHLANLFFFILCCFAFYRALRVYFEDFNPWLLFFITLLFVLHPIHTEVVANCKSLDEILSLLFSLYALLFIKTLKPQNLLWGILFFILALLSKISALTLLSLGLVYGFSWIGKKLQIDLKTIQKKIDPFVLASILFIAIYGYLVYNDLGGNHPFVFLYLAAPFILFIANRKVKAVFILALTVLLSLHGRWEFALLVFYIHFSSHYSEQKKEQLILLGEFFVFAITTSILDNNSFLMSFLILASLASFNYFQFGVRQHKKTFRAICFTLLLFIFLTSIQENTLKLVLLFIFLSLVALINFKIFSLKKKIILLFFFIPVLELYEFPEDLIWQENAVTETVLVENIQSGVKTPILPFHNILISAGSKSEKYATICRIQLIYLQKLIFPTALVHQHGTWQIKLASWKDWDVYLSILIHVLLLWLAYYFYRQKYYITMWGILWYFSTISIYTNIIRLMPDTLAERFLFLPSIGFSIAFVSGCYFLIQKFQKEEKKSLVTLGLLLLPLFGYYAFKTIDRNKDWKDNYTLAANTLPYAQNNAAINAQYALELNNLMKYNVIPKSDSAQALVIKHYKKAIDIFPDFYGPNADLANFYILKSKPTLAFPYLKEAARLKPEEWIHHYFLGLIYYERKEYALGVENFTALIQDSILQTNPIKFPELLEAYEFKARCLHNIGKDEEAYNTLNEAVEVFNQRSTYVLLSNLYRMTGKVPLAIETFERLLLITPGDQELINTIELLRQGKIL
jgi:tetratricopeptide (TPR) repeat protein